MLLKFGTKNKPTQVETKIKGKLSIKPLIFAKKIKNFL